MSGRTESYGDDRPVPRGRSRSRDRGHVDPRRDHRPSRSKSPSRRHHSRSRSRSPRPRHKDRSRSGDRDPDRERRRRPRSPSSSRSRSRSSDASTSSDTRRKRRRREKDKGKERDHKHKRRSSRSRERKERKREKKDKKDKKKKKGGAVTQWGRYGIISETDLYNKEQEFRTWLVEERMINPETISKDQTKKEFTKFVEDFNTATLPHEKYYNIEHYDRRMNALRAGETLPPMDDGYDPNADIKEHASRHKKKEVEHDSYLSKEQLQELRKVQQERIEAGKMKRLGMDVKQSFGVRMEFDN
ncbi:hypothetical protein JAAARDRAFT_36456 [Jaapia argillacea MUCL 33604]|uniref:Uncharacterized protein n=1 Tax=Jaapia argillacea MUCL 33604 TaxID=933084 RepID=A0A067PYC0_9AGAM|nr:hypothetical protein JAAARDRAFT_36456 [Jaapia argillacea MUCL 33604]